MSSTHQHSVENLLLASLPRASFETLEPHLSRRTLKMRDPIEAIGEAVQDVYFFETALSSNVVRSGGDQVEVGIVGRDGMSGLAVLLGVPESTFEIFIQTPGEALRIGADDLRTAIRQDGELADHLRRYAYAHMTQVAQTALANARFTLSERLARWILMCHDRLPSDTLELTHEFLALMLGVRRAGVTMEMHVLEGEGAIRNTRGHVFVRDRCRLESFAGDGYGAAEQLYERLIGMKLRRDLSPGD